MNHTDTAFTHCPYCGEEIEIVVDGSVDHQQYVEDCSVCCRPIVFEVWRDAAGWRRLRPLPQASAGVPMIKAYVFDAYGTLFDVQSVSAVTDAAFPGHGALITQIWRMKQLEYSWLRSLR